MRNALGFEEALRDLADGRARIAIVYDEAKGCCVTADVRASGI